MHQLLSRSAALHSAALRSSALSPAALHSAALRSAALCSSALSPAALYQASLLSGILIRVALHCAALLSGTSLSVASHPAAPHCANLLLCSALSCIVFYCSALWCSALCLPALWDSAALVAAAARLPWILVPFAIPQHDLTLLRLQRGALDAVALSLGCVCSLRAATTRLSRSQPQTCLYSMRSAVLLTAFTAMFVYMDAIVFCYLTQQPWYVGTGTSVQVCCHKEHMSK